MMDQQVEADFNGVVLSLQLLVVMTTKTKWDAVKDHVTGSPTHDPDAQLEANLGNADPELCIRLLQVQHIVATAGSDITALRLIGILSLIALIT